MARKSTSTEKLSKQQPEVIKEVVQPGWTYGIPQPQKVQVGEAYVHVCNPLPTYLGVKSWAEVRIKKADDAYRKLMYTSKKEALKIAHDFNKSNGLDKTVEIA